MAHLGHTATGSAPWSPRWATSVLTAFPALAGADSARTEAGKTAS
jgi:hypothetical protein